MANGKFLKLLYQHETYLYNEPCHGRTVDVCLVKFGFSYSIQFDGQLPVLRS